MITESAVSPAPRLRMAGITKRFGGVTALEGVDFEAAAGEILAICGENGAGKSTLMKILSGAITDYEGELFLSGAKVRFTGPRDAEQRGVSIIYQELNLVPELSASANIFLGREPTRMGIFLDERTMEREAADLFRRLGAGFSPRAKVKDLRIGDQQLVEIAKAIALDADILIMDEPTSALADAEVARLFSVISSLKEQGVTVLYISHKMDEVFRIADRITILRDGRKVKSFARSQTSPREVIGLMVGREIEAMAFEHDPALGDELLRVEALSLDHPDRPGAKRLDDIHFSVRGGEILGVAGLLGAGRTELLECLFGSCRGSARGRVFVAGIPALPRNPAEAIQLGLAMVTEDRKNLGLFDQLNVQDNITIASLGEMTAAGILRKGKERRAAGEMIGRLSIKTASATAEILSLSGGNQQKCILARWLLTGPRVLLLDEPTRGVDVGAKAEIYVLLRSLAREGKAIVMTSSELPELLSVCDRIIVLCEGRLTALFHREEATEEKILHAAMSFAAPNP